MPGARLSFRLGRFLDPYGPVAKRAGAPFAGPLGRSVIRAQRRSVAREFAGGFWATPRGGRVRWKKAKPFGSRKPSAQTLGGTSGRYARAWAGGAGGGERITSRTATIINTLPGAAAHRGGSGFRASGSLVTLIRPRKGGKRGRSAMGWKLGLEFGAWISEARLRMGLRLPSRPHATDNPQLKLEIARATQRYLAAGKVSS